MCRRYVDSMHVENICDWKPGISKAVQREAQSYIEIILERFV